MTPRSCDGGHGPEPTVSVWIQLLWVRTGWQGPEKAKRDGKKPADGQEWWKERGYGKGVGEQKGDRDRSPKILDASPALHWVLEVSSRKERHED